MYITQHCIHQTSKIKSFNFMKFNIKKKNHQITF